MTLSTLVSSFLANGAGPFKQAHELLDNFVGQVSELADEIMLGIALEALALLHADWSQKTFGSDETRGPIGPLKHLAKEALEAQATPGNFEEYADCLLLLLDASRRAGMSPSDLVYAAVKKLRTNQTRTWPTPVADEPVEHVRETEPTPKRKAKTS